MAKVKCKGTKLQRTIASVLTDVAQLIDFNWSGCESETYEADTLDNTDAGIPYESTGRTEGGSVAGNLFFDPALAGHQGLTRLLDTPQEEAWNITFVDTGTTDWPFTGAGFGMGLTVALSDGLKASFTIKLSKLPTFPSGGTAA
jgi:hypothetical protein